MTGWVKSSILWEDLIILFDTINKLYENIEEAKAASEVCVHECHTQIRSFQVGEQIGSNEHRQGRCYIEGLTPPVHCSPATALTQENIFA